MKYSLLCLMAPLLCAGCAKREPEPTIVVAPPAPTVAPTPVATAIPPAKNTIIIVQPTALPRPNSDTGMVIKPPPSANKSIIIATPTPEPAIDLKVKPTEKSPIAPMMKPTAKPTVKPTVKPMVKPMVKPAAKPTLTPKPAPTAKPTLTPKPAPTAKPRPKPTAVAAAQMAPKLIVRAQVVSTSKVPDPGTVAYSDSLVFSKYRVLSVEKGAYEPKEILVAQWGMKGKKLTPAARLRAGDSARLQLVPLDDIAKLERIMRNDDTGDYDSTPYFALEN